jgi:hypothetical protein
MKALVRAIGRMTPEQLRKPNCVKLYLLMVAQRQVARGRLTQAQAWSMVGRLVDERRAAVQSEVGLVESEGVSGRGARTEGEGS